MKFLALFLLMTSTFAYSKEKCDLASVGLSEYAHEIEKLYYVGTCNYRNEDYELSVQYWEKIPKILNIGLELKTLQISVLNNLGYMKFFGFGTNQDQPKAMEYWKQAVSMGNDEAEYHLCHAYADQAEPTFNLSRARRHCNKAFVVYNGMIPPNEKILKSIKGYLEQINE